MTAEPRYRHEAPSPTFAPLVMGVLIGAMLIAGVFTPWGLVYGTAFIGIPFYMWAWPDKREHERNLREENEKRLEKKEAA